MHFSPLLISSFLLAPAVLAVPREFRRSLLDLVEKRTDAISDVVTPDLAGASWVQDEGTFRYVFGTLTVPTLLSSQLDGSIGSAWVGLDSLDNSTAFFQTGITFNLVNPKGPTYNAWYWMFPLSTAVQPVPGIDTISPGHVIDIAVMAPTNNTYGTVTFHNRNTSQSSWIDMHSNVALRLKTAEWMIRAYAGTVLPNFGSIVFQNALAIGRGGNAYHPQGATIYDIQQNGKNLTSVEVNENSVNITYTNTNTG